MQDTPQPLLSILTVNWNGAHHLRECLDSLLPLDPRAEVVLVDNGSTDQSLELLRTEYPWVRLVEAGKNLGFAGGNNLGLQHCRGQFIFFLNNDTRVLPSSLEALFRDIFQYSTVHIFATLMLRHDNPDVVDSAGDTFYTWGLPFTYSGWPASHADMQIPRWVASPCAGAAVYSRHVLERIGAFDEDLFLLFEDMDLGLRAQHQGFPVLFLPDVRILHKGSATIGKQSDLAVRQATRNLFLVRLKNYPLSVLLRHTPKLMLVSLFALKGHMLHGQLRPWLQGFLQMLRLLPRFLGKRSGVLKHSRLPQGEFDRMLRKGWIRERKSPGPATP